MSKEVEIKVRIRPLELNDAYTSVQWRNDPEIWKFTLNSPEKEITIEDEIKWIHKVIKENNSYRFAIIASDEYIGNIQLTNIENSESYYGIFIGNKKYLGKGIAKKATKLILNYAFRELKLGLVKLRVRIENITAINLYRKLGFKETSRNNELIFMEISLKNFLEDA